MIKETVMIVNKSGLHARPASEFVTCAKKYKSKIRISHEGEEPVNAKSMVLLLACGFSMGDSAVITCDGEDEQDAMNALRELICSGFGE